MPPKKGRKRKATPQTSSANGTTSTNGNGDLLPPDRSTWPGWVEMESEPAFFNVTLKEMGVRGAKIQEVYGLDDELLAMLPKPVYALIFLFRYKDTDQATPEKGDSCPKHIWFANQVPDFACASVALLNILNNVKGLQMGNELRDFRDFTRDMDPLSRGDAIDDFAFVKRIHNSFARETDLLNADMLVKQKAAKAKKRAAVAKARKRKETQKAAKTQQETPAAEKPAATRASPRTSRPNGKSKPAARPSSRDSSPLSDPPDSDPDFSITTKKKVNGTQPQRRSTRTPKPRQTALTSTQSAEPAETQGDEGFHFIAYIPIAGHVWKLDGLDNFPQDLGEIPTQDGADWMNIAQPALQTRMMQYEDGGIEFNLMALVYDSNSASRAELLQNVKEIQSIETRLDEILTDWRDSATDAPANNDLINGISMTFNLSQADIDDAKLDETAEARIKEGDKDMLLIQRRVLIDEQNLLRSSIKEAMESEKADEEKARHRRHDYGRFVREWLGALAESEELSGLLESA